MKITIFEVEEWEKESFEQLAGDNDLQFVRNPLTVDNVSRFAKADIVSTFIYSDLSSNTLSQLEKPQLIATRSTGFDHIDTDYCEKQGITICNVPTYGDNTVAEHVFGLLLAISHNLRESFDRTRKGDFSLQGLRGFDLQGKVLGVIGTGNIGRHVIQIAKGFGMKVIAYDVKPDRPLASQLGFRYAELEELLSNSDVITLHVPSNKQTHHLISDEEVSLMKDGVVLINTARGDIVDIRALIRALAEGKITAAGLDVLPEEPVIREEAELLRSVFQKEHDLATLLADHILLRLRNVVVTPHSAFNTREAVERILQTTVGNIGAFVRGEARNVVTKKHSP